ncbi:MAG: hypothetical protein K2Q45_03175 [Nitrosomonas sp.]|nr:hypothetical protein [Nitrosomonas sp.]
MEVRRRKKKLISYAAIPPSGPAVRVLNSDWRIMTEMDRMLYIWFRRLHPRKCSPEFLLDKLERSLKRKVLIEEVWQSMDSAIMCKYIYKANKGVWALLTEGQIKARQLNAL